MTARAATGAVGVLALLAALVAGCNPGTEPAPSSSKSSPASAATEQVSAPEADFRTGLVQAWQLDAAEIVPAGSGGEVVFDLGIAQATDGVVTALDSGPIAVGEGVLLPVAEYLDGQREARNLAMIDAATGSTRWVRTIDGIIDCTPAAGGDLTCLEGDGANSGGAVVTLDGTTGKPKAVIAEGAFTVLTATEDLTLAASSNDSLIALDADGEVWRSALDLSAIVDVAAAGEEVVVTSQVGKWAAFDAATGVPTTSGAGAWRLDEATGRVAQGVPPDERWAVALGGGVELTSSGDARQWLGLDAATGQELWALNQNIYAARELADSHLAAVLAAGDQTLPTSLVSYAAAASSGEAVTVASGAGIGAGNDTDGNRPSDLPACPAETILLAWASFADGAGWVLICGYSATEPTVWQQRVGAGAITTADAVTYDAALDRYSARLGDQIAWLDTAGDEFQLRSADARTVLARHQLVWIFLVAIGQEREAGANFQAEPAIPAGATGGQRLLRLSELLALVGAPPAVPPPSGQANKGELSSEIAGTAIQLWADDVAGTGKGASRMLTSCWTRPASYIEQVYAAPGYRDALLDAIGAPATRTEAGGSWNGSALALRASWDEIGSTYVCPVVSVGAVDLSITADEIEHTVHRYLSRLAGSPIAPNDVEDRNALLCVGQSWDPGGTGAGPAPVSTANGTLQPTGSAAPSNTTPELQVLVTDEQGRYATAFGQVSLADGTSAQAQFVFSLDPGAQSPCLGEVRVG